MDIKRIFRGPWLWIVVAVVGVLVALQYLAPNGGYEEIDTSEMATKIESGEVKEILFVDLDQEIRAELDDGTKVIASWVGGTQRDLIQSAAQGVEAGEIEKYNVEVPRPSLLGSILATFLPFVLIILLFVFGGGGFYTGRRGTGGGVGNILYVLAVIVLIVIVLRLLGIWV